MKCDNCSREAEEGVKHCTVCSNALEAIPARQKEQQQMSPEELLEQMGYKLRGKKNGNK